MILDPGARERGGKGLDRGGKSLGRGGRWKGRGAGIVMRMGGDYCSEVESRPKEGKKGKGILARIGR
jgi:hypothetical protein